jgi:hypothetical protein
MRGMKKQHGFVEMGTLIFLMVLIFAVQQGIEYVGIQKEKNEAKLAGDTFKMWVAASMSYYQDRGAWPANTSQLLGTYVHDVPSAKVAPFGTPYQLSVVAGNMLDVRINAKTRKMASRIASVVPMATVSGFTVYARYGKPGTEPALSAFLRKDGTTPLQGEWNVGGFGISNVKDITIANLNNRTVLSGLTFSNVQQNAQTVSLVSCPPGRGSLKINVIPLSYNKNGLPFNKIGAVEGRWDGTRAFVRVWETDQNGNQAWFVPNPANASVLVQQQCGK